MSGSPPVAPPSDVQRALTLYHDIEQDLDSSADRDGCRRVVREFLALEARHGVPVTYNVAGRHRPSRRRFHPIRVGVSTFGLAAPPLW